MATAVLDIDGTLVDTNYQHALAWFRAFARFEIILPIWRIHRHIGMGGDQMVTALCGEDAESDRGDQIRGAEGEEYGRLIGEVRTMEGSRELIASLKKRGHVVVLASSAKEDEVEAYLDLSMPESSPMRGRRRPTFSPQSRPPTSSTPQCRASTPIARRRSWSVTHPGT